MVVAVAGRRVCSGGRCGRKAGRWWWWQVAGRWQEGRWWWQVAGTNGNMAEHHHKQE